AVEEVAPPAFGLSLPLVLLVLGDELLLLLPIGLEEEGAGLVERAAGSLEQLAHAAWGVPSTEGLLGPIAHLGGRPEAAGGDLLFELAELSGLQSAGVALVVAGAQPVTPAGAVQCQPVVDRPGADAQQGSDLLGGAAVSQPEQCREAGVDARVLVLAAELLDPLALQRRHRERGCALRHCRTPSRRLPPPSTAIVRKIQRNGRIT